MGTVEILPDLTILEAGSKTLGGGAGSALVALNDALDSTYIQAAGTLAQTYRAYFRFATASVPANAAIRYVQLKMRYSHFTRSSTTYEYWQPVTCLVGRTFSSRTFYDAYSAGERLTAYSIVTSPVQSVTFPKRAKDWSGKYFMGERGQMLLGRRFYGSLQLYRKTAVNLARIYALSLVVTYDEKPTVTLINPSGSEVVGRPPVDWEWSDAEAQAQEVVHVRMFSAAQVAHPLFTPEPTGIWAIKFKPFYDRVIHTPLTHHDMVSALPNGFSGRAYIRARHGAVWQPGVNYKRGDMAEYFAPLSAWDSNDFTITIAAPFKPEVFAAYDATIHGIQINVEGLDNLLPWDVSSIEPTTVPNFATTNTTLTRSVAQFLHGSASLSMNKTVSTGDALAVYPFIGADVDQVGIECEPDELYTARAWFRANTTSRTCRVLIQFYDDDGTLLSATNTHHNCTDVSTGWREATATAMAPATAKWIQIDVRAQAAVVGEIHFVDQLGLFKGRRTSRLTENQASIETDTTGWAAGTNTTVSRNASLGKRGSASLQMQKTVGTGTAIAQTPSGTSGFVVNPSQAYSASAWFTPFTTARSVRLTIDWYDAAGASTGSQAVGASFSETAFGTWVQATVGATSPAAAAFARLNLEVLSAANGEVHFADVIGFWVGSAVGADRDIHYWNQGGWVHKDPTMHMMELQRSIAVDVEGDDIWETIPEPRVQHEPQFQRLAYVDYEVPGTVTAKYRARIEAEGADENVMNSDWQTPYSTVQMPVATTWWLRDPLDPEMSMAIRVGAATLAPPKPNTTDYPIGATAAVMTHDGVKSDNVRMIVDLLDEDTYNMFRMLTGSGATLLLQDTFGRQWYVQPADIEYEVMRAVKQPAEPWPTRHFHRVKLEFISVEKPRALGVMVHA